MAYGLTIDKTPNESNVKTKSTQIVTRCKSITQIIKRIVAKYGLDDEEWAEAISSQYFLLCLAKQLSWEKKDYANLLNKCLSSFSVTYTGDYILDNEKLLVTPDETNRIIECMQQEDDSDTYFTHSAKMQAKNIDSEQMYLNFHYGLLIRIVSSEDTEILRAIKHKCLDSLTEENALDISDGWYPYRVPWITARILISLREVDYSSYGGKEKLDRIITAAISSLYQRIDEDAAYWRSGVGEWVSKWESTALCLEALYTWDAIKGHEKEVKKIINYVCTDKNKESWINNHVSFSTEENANNTLAGVILSSVILRITGKLFADLYDELCDDIIRFFDTVISVINKQDVTSVRQYCTIPQILHYVLSALTQVIQKEEGV